MIKFDAKDFNQQMQKAIDYSMGFVNGVQQNEQYYNKQ